jgi:Holliday junction resolvase RusA-like endonuclease
MATVTLMIKPQTHVRSTQGDRIYFRIPEHRLNPPGLRRKKRLERYNQYKSDLFDLAQEIGFTLPDDNIHITFFVPFGKSARKNFKLENNLRPHRVMPDVDNMGKALFDALKRRDQTISDVRFTKVWIDHPTGFIQIDY